MQLVTENVIDFEEAKENRNDNAVSAVKKAAALAKIHCRINETEIMIKNMWEAYGKAFMSYDRDNAQNITYQITALSGKLAAYRECTEII